MLELKLVTESESVSFSHFHLLIIFNRKLFSSSEYFSFVWLITFRIETFSFSDHWRFKMLINWAQSQLSPRNKTPNCFLLKLNRTLFGLFYQIFPLDKVANIMNYDRNIMFCHEHCGHCVKPGKYMNIWRQLFLLLWIVRLQSSQSRKLRVDLKLTVEIDDHLLP